MPPASDKNTVTYQLKGIDVKISKGITKDFPKNLPSGSLSFEIDTGNIKNIPGITLAFEESKKSANEVDVKSVAYVPNIIELIQSDLAVHMIESGIVKSDDGYSMFLLGQPLSPDQESKCNSDIIFSRACGVLKGIKEHQENKALPQAVKAMSQELEERKKAALNEADLAERCSNDVKNTLRKYAKNENLDHGSVSSIEKALTRRAMLISRNIGKIALSGADPDKIKAYRDKIKADLANVITEEIKKSWPQEKCVQFHLDDPNSAKRKIFIGDLEDVLIKNLDLSSSVRAV